MPSKPFCVLNTKELSHKRLLKCSKLKCDIPKAFSTDFEVKYKKGS